jgi:hypothetical protein
MSRVSQNHINTRSQNHINTRCVYVIFCRDFNKYLYRVGQDRIYT